MICKINSRQNEKIKELIKLSNPKFSKEQKLFKIEGFHALEMAIEAKVVKSVFTTKELEIDDKIPQFVVSKEVVEKVSTSKSPQGVIAVCEYKKSTPISSDKVLYLDDVSDPGNLGTLLRTALAFGYKDVVLNAGCSEYNEKVLQSTQGAIFKLNILHELDFSKLKEYEILATEIKGSVSLNEVKSPAKHVLILGNEAHGVQEKLLKLAHKRIRIDIENIESLNVAVAGAIAMYSLSK